MPRLQVGVLPKKLLARSHQKRSLRVSQAVIDVSALDARASYEHLKTGPDGLTSAEAAKRLVEHGQNILAKDQRPGALTLLWRALRNPLVILLAVLAAVSFATGDARAGTMMLGMIALSVGLKLSQESKANDAAAKLKAMISETGWFVESLLTQTLIIHVIRTNKIPFLQSRASAFLMATSAAIIALGIAIPFTPIGDYLGFTPPPVAYWGYIAATLFCYVLLTQGVKAWLLRRSWI